MLSFPAETTASFSNSKPTRAVAAGKESMLEVQRLDFERLYAVSATLARAESLAEIVPHLIGTICKYLDAQVGVVLLHDTNLARLEVMSPIWATTLAAFMSTDIFSASSGYPLTQIGLITSRRAKLVS